MAHPIRRGAQHRPQATAATAPRRSRPPQRLRQRGTATAATRRCPRPSTRPAAAPPVEQRRPRPAPMPRPPAGASSPRRPRSTIPCWSAWSRSSQLLERPTSPEALKAGLPLEDGRLTPDLALRAAARAGLSARLVRRELARISDLTLPCILLLEGRGACVLVERLAGERASVVLPETGRGAHRAAARRPRRALHRLRAVRAPRAALRPARRAGRDRPPQQLVLGHAGADLADLRRGRAGRGADQPVRAGEPAVHHERLRPRGAEQRHRDPVGAGGRRADRVPVRFPAAHPARLLRRHRRQDRRHQARRPHLRAGAGHPDGGAAGLGRRLRQQPARVREPARLLHLGQPGHAGRPAVRAVLHR